MKKSLFFISLLYSMLLLACTEDITPENIEITAEDFATTTEENPYKDDVLGSVGAEYSEGEVRFDIKSQSPEGAMAIDSRFGKLRVADPILFDFELSQTVTAVIQVSAEGAESKEINAIITLTDVEEVAPYISTWETINSNESITIYVNPQVTGYDYQVDWGDGSKEIHLKTNTKHIYTSPGIHTVKISGSFPAIYSADQAPYLTNDDETNALKLKSIESWGTTQWKSMKQAFAECANMVYNATDIPDLSQLASMENMFSAASSFNGNIGAWDVSNVADMSGMFSGASSFNGDIGDWDVSSVTNMSVMFASASSFNRNIGGWDVSRVTDISRMFLRASLFNQDIGNWDVSNVTSMVGAFWISTSFNGDISNWDVSNVTTMLLMFKKAESFNQDISTWDVSNVTEMRSMFEGASSFSQDLSGWSTDNVTGCYGFSIDSSLSEEQLPTAGSCF